MTSHEIHQAFLAAWPIERLAAMTLPEYNTAGDRDCFTYWVERRTQALGSIQGSNSLKFLVYHRRNQSKTHIQGALLDGDYAWQQKLGNDLNSAFEEARRRVQAVATAAQAGNLTAIDSIEMAHMYKWKIAFLYAPLGTVLAIFARQELEKVARREGMEVTPQTSTSALHAFICEGAPQGEDFYGWGHQLWIQRNALPGLPEIEAQEDAQHPLNLILYGPPGTGKTFATAERAVRIADPAFVPSEEKNWHDRFRELLITDWSKQDGQIAFVTFHQSYSYEDFIEGIKPVSPEPGSNDPLKYEVRPGIFKEIASRAENYRSYRSNFKEVAPSTPIGFDLSAAKFYKISLGNTQDSDEDDIYQACIERNEISLGWGGDVNYAGMDEAQIRVAVNDNHLTSFTVTAMRTFALTMKVGDIVFVSYGNYACRAIGIVTGEYEYREDDRIHFHHFRKVMWLMKDVVIPVQEIYGTNFSQQAIYKMDNAQVNVGFFNRLLSPTLQKLPPIPPKRFVLVIDEINRGNIAQVFGELITLLEEDKRQGRSYAAALSLPYSKKAFTVPDNLYVIGTMNTADRSVEALDTALRRRFHFEEMPPVVGYLPEYDPLNVVEATESSINRVDVRRLLTTINERLEVLLGRDHLIGHSFFMELDTISDLRKVFFDKIIPLLQEYFYGDLPKISLVLGPGFVQVKRAKVRFAQGAQHPDADTLADRQLVSFVDKHALDSDAAFLAAIDSLW